tara:strand:+ start:869 stop:1312 length:444 start_codon:yes stop_codon:yes gene_type:complete
MNIYSKLIYKVFYPKLINPQLKSKHMGLDIIIIDNEPNVLEMSTFSARAHGLATEGYHRGSKALEYLESLSDEKIPERILCDVNLGTDYERTFPLKIWKHLEQRGMQDRITFITGTLGDYDIKLRDWTLRPLLMKGNGKTLSEYFLS